MKKLGLGIAALVLVAAFYYVAAGSTQLRDEMKVRVNTELSKLQQQGFGVKEREVKEKEEHFVLTIEDPEKVAAFYKTQGTALEVEDAEALKGLKIGVDLAYLNDSYAALSVDLYPLALPDALSKNKALTEEDKALIAQFNEMLKRKALLVHIDFNKLLSGFKGYVKDINETVMLQEKTVVTLKGNSFKGEIKEERITALKQEIKEMGLVMGELLDLHIEESKSSYALNGKTVYDSRYDFTVKNVTLNAKVKDMPVGMHFSGISGEDTTAVNDNLASNSMKLQVASAAISDGKTETKLTESTLSFKISNLDMDILKQIDATDVNDTEKIDALVQSLLSKGITLEVPALEVKRLEYLGQKMDGFTITSSFTIHKNIDFAAAKENPLLLLNALESKTKITLSDALFTLIAKQPQAMLLAMFIQPKVVNGKKIYELELKEGKLTVNGAPLM